VPHTHRLPKRVQRALDVREPGLKRPDLCRTEPFRFAPGGGKIRTMRASTLGRNDPRFQALLEAATGSHQHLRGLALLNRDVG
jgi:hypothetical protein